MSGGLRSHCFKFERVLYALPCDSMIFCIHLGIVMDKAARNDKTERDDRQVKKHACIVLQLVDGRVDRHRECHEKER